MCSRQWKLRDAYICAARKQGHQRSRSRSLICRTQVVQILFCIDKARKRSFTEVALNSVLEENAASAIDFEWEIYSPNKNIYEQCICCVSQLFHRRFNPGTLRIARSAVRTLRSVQKNKQERDF